MISSNEKPSDTTLMLRLFEDHVRKQMKNALRPDLEKVLDEAIEGAMASLQVTVETMYQKHTDERLIQIILNDKRTR